MGHARLPWKLKQMQALEGYYLLSLSGIPFQFVALRMQFLQVLSFTRQFVWPPACRDGMS